MLCTLGNVDSYHSAARQCLHCCKIYQANPMGIAKFRGGESELPNPWTDCQKIWRGWLRRWWLTTCQNAKLLPHWGVAAYAWNITLAWFLARDVIYTSRAYATMSVSVCLSVCLCVTEVHWRIIANLGFKFQSQFTAHCGRGACGHEGKDHRREEWRDHLALY